MERESFRVGVKTDLVSISNTQTVEKARKRCQALLNRVHGLPLSRVTDSCKRTLLRLINAELRFLSRLPDSFPATSVNIGYIESVVHILQQPFITGVSRVCKEVPLSGHHGGISKASHPKGAHVDIVCTAGRSPVWFLVSDRNPKNISWSGTNRNKGLGIRVKEILEAAYSTSSLKPEFVLLFFSNGVDEVNVRKLKDEFGASEAGHEEGGNFEEVENDWINITWGGQLASFTDTESCREYLRSRMFQIKIDCIINTDRLLDINSSEQKVDVSKSELSEIISGKLSNDRFSSIISGLRSSSKDFVDAEHQLILDKVFINFDTTALVALVSGISNGDTNKLLRAPDSALRERFKGNVKFIMEQVNFEIQNPLLEVMRGLIYGKCGIISETVHLEFKKLVSMYGGPNEKARADALLKRLQIVPDHPSERMMTLPTTRKIALKNKIIFGTGDYWKTPTLTANTGFVRAIIQTGMSLSTLEHSPRALTGD